MKQIFDRKLTSALNSIAFLHALQYIYSRKSQFACSTFAFMPQNVRVGGSLTLCFFFNRMAGHREKDLEVGKLEKEMVHHCNGMVSK